MSATEGAASSSLLVAREEYKSTHPFSEVFPPPYRVILLLSLGVFCWAANIHGLRLLGLKPDELLAGSSDAAAAVGADEDGEGRGSMGSPPLPVHAARKYDHEDEDGITESTPSIRTNGHVDRHWISYAPKSIYAISGVLGLWAMAHWFFFRLYVAMQGDPSGRHAQAFQGIAVLGVIVAAVWPGNVLYKARRKQFGRSILPLILPRLVIFRPPTFPSILLADVLTSFAKVFGDVWLTACFLVPRKEHHTWWNGRGSWVVPVLVSFPYAVRLVQCVAEYQYTPIYGGGAVANGTGALRTVKARSRRPLANALKYASAFPVIWISASQSSRAGAVPDQREGGGSTWTLWLLAVFVNSLFSFWWDVTNDWGLEIFKPETWASTTRQQQQHQRRPSHGDIVTPQPMHRRGLSTWPAPRGGSHDEGFYRDDDASSSGGSRDASSSALLGSPLRHSHAPHARQPSRYLRRADEGYGALFSPTVYQSAILIDLVLRFTWSLKLSPHLAQLVDLESGVFVLETLEILRRCGWVFLRCEWEAVKRRRAKEWLRSSSGRVGPRGVKGSDAEEHTGARIP